MSEVQEETRTPPAEAPRDNPRPAIDRLRTWPFVVGGGVAALVLAGVTIGPSLFRGEQSVARAEPDQHLSQARGVRGLATDYTQVAQDPVAEQKASPPTDQPIQQQQQQFQQGYQQQRTGPSKAELLRAARMANLKPVKYEREQPIDEDGGGGSGGGGGKLYSNQGLTQPSPCQTNAGTNIPAMMEVKLTSEGGGIATAVVNRDIWSANKKCLTIPRGTKFVGKAMVGAANGQTRMGVLWTGFTRPPPRNDTMELDSVVAGDPDGSAGLSGEVDTHFWSKLGYVGAATLIDLGSTAITAGGEGGVGAAIAGIFAGNASSPMNDWAKKKLDVPDVITVKPKEISIVLSQHLDLDEFRGRRK
jgi:type IV secretory pathway VirB10-like protein